MSERLGLQLGALVLQGKHHRREGVIDRLSSQRTYPEAPARPPQSRPAASTAAEHVPPDHGPTRLST